MRKVIVMSGVSGSGKTTHAGHLLQDYLSSQGFNPSTLKEYNAYFGGIYIAKVSADDFFTGEDGVYRFDPAQIGAAHDACFRAYIKALQAQTKLVVVDNTNCTNEEIAPYMLGASAFGYEAKIITLLPVLTGELDLRERYAHFCANRNSHGANFDTVMGQLNRLFTRALLPWWENTNIEVRF